VRRLSTDTLAAILTIGACVSVALLFWFGYRAVAEWRDKSMLLAERQSSDAADLLISALTRDMGGVQASVLTSPQWNQFSTTHPHEMNALIASAFARYPYPEAFFAWERGSPYRDTVMFYRADRRPPWSTPPDDETVFPVVTAHEPAAATELFGKIAVDAGRGKNLSFFEGTLNGTRCQIVAQLMYTTNYRQELSTVIGFTVNLDWIRDHYFSELTQQVWNIGHGADTGLTMQIIDAAGRVVAGRATDLPAGPLSHRRPFDLLFVDSQSAFPVSSSFVPEKWSVIVSGAGSTLLLRDSVASNRVLTFAAVSSLLFALGLILTARAVRTNTQLTDMRSDFVSAVTHELKTPIATIKAAAETLAKDRLTGMSVHTCGRIVMMESSRLARLVENLLAYARITDVSDSYSFQPVEVAVIFNDIQQDFEARLDQQGFELHLASEQAADVVSGDRFALRLLFGNLLDNAIKYSRDRRIISLRATRSATNIVIEVEDEGVGIAADELPKVMRKFVRAKNATGGGSGLGLSIAGRIAQDHHGNLQMASEVGRGTIVTVTLPAAERPLQIV
jgi:signal transduction histidine kinase